MIIPDKNWWLSESKKRDALPSCPYANSYKCPRHYESLTLLSSIHMTAGITEGKSEELKSFWEKTSFSALCTEEAPSISMSENKSLSSISNFCPEVSFKYLDYYADYMCKYVDEIDRDTGYSMAKMDDLMNDWRYLWMSVNSRFYLDCEIFSRVRDFNEQFSINYLNRLHPNIVQQIGRMDACLDNQDPAGALHAASNILETMAKQIIGSQNVDNQPLGRFFSQFEKSSTLPKNLIEAVLQIYNLRNKLPTAGHGSLAKQELTMVEAIGIAVMTKAILEMEYRAKTILTN